MVELSASEIQDLKSALDRQLTQLMSEMSHTDNRAYREGLEHTYNRLERLYRKLYGTRS